MSCASCAKKIEKKLQAIEGIKKATVNFAIEEARIELNESGSQRVNSVIKSAESTIATLGYLAKVKDGRSKTQYNKMAKDAEGDETGAISLIKLIMIGLLALTVFSLEMGPLMHLVLAPLNWYLQFLLSSILFFFFG